MRGEQEIKPVTVEPVTMPQMKEFFRQQEERDGQPPRIHSGNFQNYLDCPNGFGQRFAIPLHDKGVPEPLRKFTPVYREIAIKEFKIKDLAMAVAYRQFSGFTLKFSARFAGPCTDDYRYLQSWNFDDVATTDAIVFWVPALFERACSLNPNQQLEVLGEIREKYKLPAHHLTNFGEVGSNADLILTHYQRTGEMIPARGLWARMDTLDADGSRLELFWGGGRLHCDGWSAGYADGNLGCFVRGVEKLEPLAA